MRTRGRQGIPNIHVSDTCGSAGCGVVALVIDNAAFAPTMNGGRRGGGCERGEEVEQIDTRRKGEEASERI